MTFGFSRDDAGKFLDSYYKAKIYESDPFTQRLDQTGVGRLVELAVKEDAQTRPELKCGICGEHGGDPSSVEFCHKVGLNYVKLLTVPCTDRAGTCCCRLLFMKRLQIGYNGISKIIRRPLGNFPRGLFEHMRL